MSNSIRRLVLALLMVSLSNASVGDSLRTAVSADDFVISEVMIPMRDGVSLSTFIVTPKHFDADLPILLMRTPYGAAGQVSNRNRTTGAALLGAKYAELAGYIWVFQDVRGRYKSEGEYTAFRPLRGPFNDSETDHTTDGWDTVDWLVKNVENNNGRVGVFGTSYGGWLVLTTLLDPHPAVKAAVPVAPMVDLWMGDDAFHNGAFRIGYMLEYSYRLETKPDAQSILPHDDYDLYSWWLKQGSPRELKEQYLPNAPLFSKIVERPAYDDFWQDIAIQNRFKKLKPSRVPTLNVHGWFDQEDMHGAPTIYEVLENKDPGNDVNFFTAGPWYHGESWANTHALGSLDWSESTGRRWREDVLAPFLDHYLKDAPPHRLSNATVFNTGTSRWESFDEWPGTGDTEVKKLYLDEGRSLSWQNESSESQGSESYLSDPNAPIPYQLRPIRAIYSDDPQRGDWRIWQVADQRFVDGRPDVLTFVSEPLAEAITVRGNSVSHLFSATTGSDADWVVKLIDVFPDQDARNPEMSGYQFMVSGEILRGRYRESFSRPEAIVPNQAAEYTILLPQINHTFQPGHRLMVQIQSSWFPLYDRNPQTWIPSIMDVKSSDYQKATHTVFYGGELASHIELQVVNP